MELYVLRLTSDLKEVKKNLNENKQSELGMTAARSEIRHIIDNYLKHADNDLTGETGQEVLNEIQQLLKEGINVADRDKTIAQLMSDIDKAKAKRAILDQELEELQYQHENNDLKKKNSELLIKKQQLEIEMKKMKEKQENAKRREMEMILNCETLQKAVNEMKNEIATLQQKKENQEKRIAALKKPKKVKKFNI